MHTATGHGEDDYKTGMREKLEIYSPVLGNGRFDDTAPEWLRGKTVWEGNPLITQRLRDDGFLFAEADIRRSYPHDWRSKKPIIFRATEQWFIKMDEPFTPAGSQTPLPSLREVAVRACGGHPLAPVPRERAGVRGRHADIQAAPHPNPLPRVQGRGSRRLCP